MQELDENKEVLNLSFYDILSAMNTYRMEPQGDDLKLELKLDVQQDVSLTPYVLFRLARSPSSARTSRTTPISGARSRRRIPSWRSCTPKSTPSSSRRCSSSTRSTDSRSRSPKSKKNSTNFDIFNIISLFALLADKHLDLPCLLQGKLQALEVVPGDTLNE